MKKIKRFSAALIAGLMLMSVCGCSEKKDEEYPLKLAGMEIAEKPKKVICLSDSLADILIASGYAGSIAARTEECTQQDIENLPSVGSKSNPSFARIQSVDPDVIFADKTVDGEMVRKLEKNGYKVFNMIKAKDGRELSVLYSTIGAIMEGDKTGRQHGTDKASSLLQSFDAMERAIPDAEEDDDGQVKEKLACYLYDVNGTAVTSGTFTAKLFDYAKLHNACANSDTNLAAVEAVRLNDPEYIFCASGVKEQIMKSEKFEDVAAVQKGQVYEISADDMERQGDTMTEVLSFMIQTAYPELRSDSYKDESEETQVSEEKKEESKETSDNKKHESSKAESSQEAKKPPFEITDDMLLGIGLQDAKVKKLQQRLKELGYSKFSDGITGFYGEETQRAVTAFQKKNGLEAGGAADAKTLKLLFSDDAKKA